MKEKCENYKFFVVLGGIGTCHRYPPASDGLGSKKVDEQPMVKKENWCGEFKK